MSNAVRVTYTPRSDATPEAEIGALSAVFRFVIDCHAKKSASIPDKSRPKDPDNECKKHEEVSNVEHRPDRRPGIVITRQRKLRTQ